MKSGFLGFLLIASLVLFVIIRKIVLRSLIYGHSPYWWLGAFVIVCLVDLKMNNFYRR
jgi:hypothetical protein